MSDKQAERIDVFLAELSGYVKREEHGPLADLRRGFSKTTEHRAWPYLAKYCDLTSARQRAIWQTIGAGFATIRESENVDNLGHTMRGLAIGERKGKSEQTEALKSFDGRFRRLLTCRTPEQVCEHLPGIIRAASRKGVGVNFRQLFWDLMSWNSDKRDIRVEWAAAYWGVRREAA